MTFQESLNNLISSLDKMVEVITAVNNDLKDINDIYKEMNDEISKGDSN